MNTIVICITFIRNFLIQPKNCDRIKFKLTVGVVTNSVKLRKICVWNL